MIANQSGYIAVIVTQQVFIVGLVWYVMHLLDSARHERRRYNNTMLVSNASASCDLASLAARLSKFGDEQPDLVAHPATARVGQGERA